MHGTDIDVERCSDNGLGVTRSSFCSAFLFSFTYSLALLPKKKPSTPSPNSYLCEHQKSFFSNSFGLYSVSSAVLPFFTDSRKLLFFLGLPSMATPGKCRPTNPRRAFSYWTVITGRKFLLEDPPFTWPALTNQC
jgi:hypothetical protein